MMGLPLLIGLVLAIAIYFAYRNKIPESIKNGKCVILLKISSFMAILALVLSMDFIPYSKIGDVHEIINRLINIFEFPFRFMCIVSIMSATAIVSVCVLWKNGLYYEKKEEMKIKGYVVSGGLVILVMLGTLLSYWKLLAGDSPFVKNYEYYAIGYIMDMDKWLPAGADQGEVSHELLKGSEDIHILDYKKEYTNINMTCINEGAKEGYVDVPLFYYPCYKAVDRDTKEALGLTYGENERIRIILPVGYQGTVILKVGERKLWRFAEAVSVLSILASLYLIITGQSVMDAAKRLQKGKQKT